MANTGVGSIGDFRKRVTKTYESITTSYHEAGHTVYGLLHLMVINSVYVFEDKKNKRICGFTQYYSIPLDTIEPGKLLNNRVYAEIGLSYAGLVAEKFQFQLASGSPKFPLFLKDGSSDDTLEASSIIRKYEVAPPGRKRYEFKKKIIREVGKELQVHWDAVTIIAHALFRKKKLDFGEIKSLLTKKSRNKKFWKEHFKTISSIYRLDGAPVYPPHLID